MPTPINPRGEDNPSTYFVEDRSNNAEMIRLMLQDLDVTQSMGGPLAEQPNPASLHRALDVGCGPGGWILEAARMYPHMDFVGIDISWRMIEYAHAQAQAQRLTDGVEFLVMDALRPLEFPDASFDLINIRLGSSFMLVKDWPRLLNEMLRVTRPGGIVRVTDADVPWNNSPTLRRLEQMFLCAGYKAGNSATSESWGVAQLLPQLLAESGYQGVQSTPYLLEYFAGTEAGDNFYQNVRYLYQTLLPFLQKWDCASEDYEALYEQAMIEMQQKDFRATWKFVTAWGTKPQNEQEVMDSGLGHTMSPRKGQ